MQVSLHENLFKLGFYTIPFNLYMTKIIALFQQHSQINQITNQMETATATDFKVEVTFYGFKSHLYF